MAKKTAKTKNTRKAPKKVAAKAAPKKNVKTAARAGAVSARKGKGLEVNLSHATKQKLAQRSKTMGYENETQFAEAILTNHARI